MMPTKDTAYYPLRGLFAVNFLQAAIGFMKISRMEWAERVITSRRNGHIQTVTYHHIGNGKYSRRHVHPSGKLNVLRTELPKIETKSGHLALAA